jgi:hypothetical protein
MLPEHYISQGIHCLCSHRQLKVLKRVGHPVIFARCEFCESEFKVYAQEDYPAGYIADDPTKPLEAIKCDNCQDERFHVAVGYEYPGDEIDSTDITWFTLIGECIKCKQISKLFDDETG